MLFKTNPVAVVTGASDGIGKEYAIELARRGSNVCLVGRSKEKLDAVQEEIKKNTPNAQTRVVIIDLAHANEVSWVKFATDIADLNITILSKSLAFTSRYLLMDPNSQQRWCIV